MRSFAEYACDAIADKTAAGRKTRANKRDRDTASGAAATASAAASAADSEVSGDDRDGSAQAVRTGSKRSRGHRPQCAAAGLPAKAAGWVPAKPLAQPASTQEPRQRVLLRLRSQVPPQDGDAPMLEAGEDTDQTQTSEAATDTSRNNNTDDDGLEERGDERESDDSQSGIDDDDDISDGDGSDSNSDGDADSNGDDEDDDDNDDGNVTDSGNTAVADNAGDPATALSSKRTTGSGIGTTMPDADTATGAAAKTTGEDNSDDETTGDDNCSDDDDSGSNSDDT